MQVIIFGLGALGSNIFVQLIRQFPEWHYTGVDFDRVEGRNLRVQAYYKEQVGQFKAHALAVIGQRYVNKLQYILKNIKLTDKTAIPFINDDEHLYLDCFDNASARTLVNPVQGNILHLGISVKYAAEAIWNEKYSPPKDLDPSTTDICTMTDAVGFIHYFTGMAVNVIADWAKNGNKRSFVINQQFGKVVFL